MRRYGTIPETISYETIDGETIVINLDKGHYYSLESSASEIWNAISEHIPVDEILQAYSQMVEDVQAFLDHLQKEGLVNYVSHQGQSKDQSFVPSIMKKPELTKFTDMEDLLLLDPIHETDARGWPHQLGQK